MNWESQIYTMLKPSTTFNRIGVAQAIYADPSSRKFGLAFHAALERLRRDDGIDFRPDGQNAYSRATAQQSLRRSEVDRANALKKIRKGRTKLALVDPNALPYEEQQSLKRKRALAERTETLVGALARRKEPSIWDLARPKKR